MSSLEIDLSASGHEALNQSLSSAAHDIPPAEAEQIVADHYGIRGTASPLTSERDHNFRIAASDGKEYVFKISNAAEDPLIAEFQVEALLHIARVDATLPVLGDVKLVTSLFFDMGVYLIVVGLILDVLRSLGAELDRQEDEGDEIEARPGEVIVR